MGRCCFLAALLAAALALGPTGGAVAAASPGEAEALDRHSESGTPVSVPDPTPEAMRYYRSGNALWVVNLLWGALVPGVVLFTGFSSRLRTWAERLGGGRWLATVVLFFGFYSLLVFALDLPLAYYQGFLRQHAYGLSNQSLAKWLTDALKALGLGLVGGALVIWMPFLLLKRSPRRWWLYTGLAAVPFFFTVMLVAPVWIDPLFNDFGPMQDKALEARILAAADRVGVDVDQVYEVDKSVDTKRVNAYVTGFLGTKRVVLWDTLLERMEPDEVVFVMSHELGHFVLGHVVLGVLVFSAIVMAGLYLVYRTAGSILDRSGDRFGFTELSDVASLPLLLLLLNIFGFVMAPAGLAYSRWQEREADRFGLELTQDGTTAAHAFVGLQTENLSNPYPGPIYRFWRASHPPIGERVDFCNTYRPWATGEPLRYGHHFD